ncbi:MAG: thioredoxin family protein [Bacteroidota bacterium]
MDNKRQLIENALPKAFDYSSYKELVEQLFKNGKATGNTQSEAFLSYTKLSLQRMKRWDKTAKIDQDYAEQIKNIATPQTWLVITEGWCGDAANALPYINKLAELNPNIDLKLVLRDDNDELMNAFLTNGGKSIPKLIAFEPASKNILFTWGPRPSTATKMVEDEKKSFGEIRVEFRETLQLWYTKNKGVNIVEDLVQLAVTSKL